MKVRAYIYSEDDELIALSAIHADFASFESMLSHLLRRELAANKPVDGELTYQEDGVYHTIYDAYFDQLIPDVVLRPIPTIVHGKIYTSHNSSDPRTIAFVPRDDQIQIYDWIRSAQQEKDRDPLSGPPIMIVPCEEFSLSMLETGTQFVEVWERLCKMHPDLVLEKRVKRSREMLDEARAAIKEAYG